MENKKTLIWILILTITAGYMNAVSILGLNMTASHQTGNISQSIIMLFKGETERGGLLLGALFFFFSGAFVAGLLFGQLPLGQHIRYGASLILPGLYFLLLSTSSQFASDTLLYFMITFSLGLQNGIFAKYRGLVLRSTHLTGYLTDAGTALGRVIRGEKDELFKFFLFAGSIVIFAIGGFGGAWAHSLLGRRSVSLIGLFQLLAGFYYYFEVYERA